MAVRPRCTRARFAALSLAFFAAACGNVPPNGAAPAGSDPPVAPDSAPSANAVYDAQISSSASSLEVEMGGRARVPLVVVNRGSIPWMSAGTHPIYLSFHLLNEDGTPLRYDNPRTPFPRPVAPGAGFEGELTIDTLALPRPGSYLVQVDLVHEGRTWFGERGSRVLEIPLHAHELSFALEAIPTLELAKPTASAFRSSVPALEGLFKLVEVTLRSTLLDLVWNGARYSGFVAGAHYPQFWVRDNATIVAMSRWFFGAAPSTGWIELHLARQRPDGQIWDWIDARGATDKNTVETDQETSLVYGACLYARQSGDLRWLRKPIGEQPILERLDRALEHVWNHRREPETGLVLGAHTIDWGDVDIIDVDESAVYTDERTIWTTDVYDQAMFVLAARELASVYRELAEVPQRARKWEARAERIATATRHRLWDDERGFFRVHVHVTPLTHDFEEGDVFGMGGNAVAILSGIARDAEAERIFRAATARQRQYGISTIGASVLPPYPSGTYSHPLARDAYSYQNGGQWDWFGGRLVLAMYRSGHSTLATAKLGEIAKKAAVNRGIFEWEDRDGEPRGSAWYSGGAGVLGQVLVEGYLGIHSWFDDLRISPRLGKDSGTIALVDRSAGRFISYDYAYDPLANRVRCQVFTDFPTPVEFEFLLPERLRGSSRVFADGEPVPFTRRSLGDDRFSAFSRRIPPRGVTIEIRN